MKYIKGGAMLAVVLLNAQTSWAQAPKFSIQNFEVSGNTLLSAEVTKAVVEPFLGDDRGMDDIAKAADALRKAYADAGYPVVQVFPPEQTAASGIVTLRVIEGKLSKVSVTGIKQYDEANIRASLPTLQEGVSPKAAEVISDIVLANENPAKQVAVNFQSGANPGDIEARIDVTEDRVEKYTLTYDNSGSVAAGFNKISFGYQNANVGNLDHMLTLGVNSTIEHAWDKGLNLVGGYRIPFYEYGLSVDFIGSYSDSRTSTPLPGGAGSMNFSGKGFFVGARVNQALPSMGTLRHKLTYGLDYKDFDNECTAGVGATPAPCNTVTLIPLSIGYSAQVATPDYQFSGALNLASNFRGGPHGTDQSYAADTPGSSVNWSVWRGNLGLSLPLPEDWQFRAALSMQDTSKRLVNAERFGVGGANSVRGYAERVISGDTGYVANVEFYTPDFGKLVDDTIKARGVFFIDQGEVRQINDALPPIALRSIGLGLRLNYGKDLSIKADLGFSQTPQASQNGTLIPTMPQKQAYGLKPIADHWGLHVSATYTF